jgi:hypothetical protein
MNLAASHKSSPMLAGLKRPGNDVLETPSTLVYEYMVQTFEAEDLASEV